MLSEGTGYNGLSKSILADEYVAFIVQHFYDKTGIKSNLKYQKIIEDEYTRKNENRLRLLRREFEGTNRNANINNRENIKDSRSKGNNIQRGISSGFRQRDSGEEGQGREINKKNITNEREISLPLHNIIKEGEIDYEQLKEITGRITSGNATITRLNKEEEQGRSRGGRTAVEATILLAADERANSQAFSEQESWQIAEHQEKVLKEYAKHKKIWLKEEDIQKQSTNRELNGAESHVYSFNVDGERYVIKVVDYHVMNETPQDFIDNRISLHNHLFEETPYELIGFTENEDGFAFVVKQPYIQGSELETLEKYVKLKEYLNEYMKEKLGNFNSLMVRLKEIS